MINSHLDESVLSQCLIISISVEPSYKFDFMWRVPGNQAFLNRLRAIYHTDDPQMTQTCKDTERVLITALTHTYCAAGLAEL